MIPDEKPTIFTLEHGGCKITTELSWDADIHDLINAFYAMCIGVSFIPSTIIDGMKEFIESKEERVI